MHSVITRTVVSGLTIELPALFFNVKNWLRIVALSTPFGYYRKTDRLLCLLTLLLVLILVTVSGVSVFVLLQ
ncbi:TPA: hypothetical protein ACHGEH_005354 [Escherichia coli]